MPKYEPPPPSLEHLNPIQRYMQKGSLDRADYIRLVLLVFIYFTLRPYISKLFKWLFEGSDVKEGEEIRKEYAESKKAKVAPNAIRTGKGESAAPSTVSGSESTTSGSKISRTGGVVNRKSKITFAEEKTEEEKLLDWDDEPSRRPVDGDKADVTTWLDHWDK